MIALDRRHLLGHVLEGVAGLIGLAALPPGAMAAGKTAATKPRLLDAPTTALLTAVADTLIPRTDTPGAVQVKVPATFDALLRDWANPQHRAAHIAALKAIDAEAVAKTGKPFAALAPSARKAFLQAYDAANLAANADYAKLKDLLVSLYYLTEAGATQELRYEHVPGAWEPSIPLTKETRAWGGWNVG